MREASLLLCLLLVFACSNKTESENNIIGCWEIFNNTMSNEDKEKFMSNLDSAEFYGYDFQRIMNMGNGTIYQFGKDSTYYFYPNDYLIKSDKIDKVMVLKNKYIKITEDSIYSPGFIAHYSIEADTMKITMLKNGFRTTSHAVRVICHEDK